MAGGRMTKDEHRCFRCGQSHPDTFACPSDSLTSKQMRTFSFDGEGIYEMPEGVGEYVLASEARAEIERLRAICAAAYQMAGAYDAPVRFLDALALHDEYLEMTPDQIIDALLPVDVPDETTAPPKKYVFHTLAMLGQMYDEAGEEAHFPDGAEFYLAADVGGRPAVEASGDSECQHDLLKPGTTIEVIDKWKAKCKVCIEFFDLPGLPEKANEETK